MISKTNPPPATARERREARLAEELRANLQKRKVQARSRRIGEADERPDGLAAASDDMAGKPKA